MAFVSAWTVTEPASCICSLETFQLSGRDLVLKASVAVIVSLVTFGVCTANLWAKRPRKRKQ